jgi:hypothetical protein
MSAKEKYKPIEVRIGCYEGHSIYETITVAEQKEFIEGGYGTLNDLVDFYKNNQRDWLSDC